MPSVDQRLKQITLKIERAKNHVRDLDSSIRAFLDTNPYKVAIKRDPDTRKPIYYIFRAEPTPESLPLLAGDAIHNLRSALDHLAYQIVCSETQDRPPKPNGIYFPIFDSAEKYKTEKKRKMEGARQQTFDAIDAIKPYKGGNDSLWVLHQLNNIEKHRLLLTVGSRYRSVNIGAHASKMFAGINSTDPSHPLHGLQFPSIDAFFRPSDVLFPLKAGDELFIDAPDAEFDENMQFRFDVALCEPQIVEAQSLLEKVHEFTTLVEGIVAALAPRLA